MLFDTNMIATILGVKKEMEARFDTRGRRAPVTKIFAEPNIVILKRENRVQLGLAKSVGSPRFGEAGKAPKFRREVKTEVEVQVGDKVTVSIFTPGDEVKVTGTTKGKGFAGVVRRWGFAGGPKTHGQSDRHRAPGSIGQTTTPGRVYKGKRMAGHMGNVRHTVTGLEVIEVDSEKNLLVVKGSVPGAANGYLIVEKTGKVKTYTPSPEEKPEEEKSRETEGTEEPKGNKNEDQSTGDKTKEEKKG